jgi:hypothetical protein
MTTKLLRCPHCRRPIPEVAQALAQFSAEIARLSSLVTSSDEEGPFVGSRNRRHFHRLNCKWATYITTTLMLEFSSHREAVEAGMRPCKTCRA